MPRAWACVGERSSTTSPPTFTTPASGLWMPARIFTSVLLPAPFSPTNACTSPGNRRKSTPCRACTPPKCLAIPLSETMGSGGFVTCFPLFTGKLDGPDPVQYNYWLVETFQLYSKKYAALPGGGQSKLGCRIRAVHPTPSDIRKDSRELKRFNKCKYKCKLSHCQEVALHQ